LSFLKVSSLVLLLLFGNAWLVSAESEKSVHSVLKLQNVNSSLHLSSCFSKIELESGGGSLPIPDVMLAFLPFQKSLVFTHFDVDLNLWFTKRLFLIFHSWII
jgi:hypothetical protein